MPIRITPTTPGGADYGHVTLGPVDHTVQVPINLTTRTTGEIDRFGYLKPGVVVVAGTIVGITVEAIKVANDNAPATIAALPTDFQIGVATIGQVLRHVVEDNLGRALTGGEVASLTGATSRLVLLG